MMLLNFQLIYLIMLRTKYRYLEHKEVETP
jgi:hypothetical protein